MATASHWSGTVAMQTVIQSEYMVLATALIALKSLHSLLLEIGSVPNDFDLFPNAFGVDTRSPLDQLNVVTKSEAENKDADEADDDDDDEEDDNGEDSDDEDDDSGDDDDDEDEDDDDDEESSDDEGGTNHEGGTDDDDSDSDEDDEDDEDDDEDDEEEEQNLPVFKKTK